MRDSAPACGPTLLHARAQAWYIVHMCATHSVQVAATAGSLLCLAFMAACMAAWWAMSALTYSCSVLNGVFASVSGLTRCASEYSAIRVMILEQCSSLVLILLILGYDADDIF